MKNTEKTMEKIVNLCKGRGFIFSGSEIYGGLANTWDYGPLGVDKQSSRQSRHSFQSISSERLAYCPSQNRTCGFPAYGSSNSHWRPVPYIGR